MRTVNRIQIKRIIESNGEASIDELVAITRGSERMVRGLVLSLAASGEITVKSTTWDGRAVYTVR